VPFPFLDQGGGEAAEADADVVLAGGGVEAETAGEEFRHGEVLGSGETCLGELDGAHAAEVEAADGFPGQVVGEEVPLALDAGEVVGAHVAGFRFGGGRFPVGEFQFDGLAQGGADGLKGFRADGDRAEIAKGDEGGEVVAFQGDLFGEGSGEFLEGGLEGLLKGGAGEFREGFLREDEGDEFALVEGGEGREFLAVFGEAEAAPGWHILEVVAEGIAEVFHIAKDGAAVDLEIAGDAGGIGIVATAHLVEDVADAANGWSGTEFLTGSGSVFESFHGSLLFAPFCLLRREGCAGGGGRQGKKLPVALAGLWGILCWHPSRVRLILTTLLPVVSLVPRETTGYKLVSLRDGPVALAGHQPE
jgi:hypothetical protein